jgi:hypothetical protein
MDGDPAVTPPTPLGELPHGPVTPGIRASLERAIGNQVPDGKRGVLLQVRGTNGQLAFGVAAKLDRGWSLAGDVERAWDGPIAGTVSVVKTW